MSLIGTYHPPVFGATAKHGSEYTYGSASSFTYGSASKFTYGAPSKFSVGAASRITIKAGADFDFAGTTIRTQLGFVLPVAQARVAGVDRTKLALMRAY